MAYILKQPFSEIERADFIVNHNHNRGLNIIETTDAIYALLPNEEFNGSEVVITNHQPYDMRKKWFKKNFFETSIGWIKRKAKINDGIEKDFFFDILPLIKLSFDLGIETTIVCYQTPNFSNEICNKYLKTLEKREVVTIDFIKECLEKTFLEIM